MYTINIIICVLINNLLWGSFYQKEKGEKQMNTGNLNILQILGILPRGEYSCPIEAEEYQKLWYNVEGGCLVSGLFGPTYLKLK